MAAINSPSFDGWMVGEVKKVDPANRRLGVYIHKLMANIPSTTEQELQIPTVTNPNLSNNIDSSTYARSVDTVNYIWVRSTDMREKMPDVGSKVLVWFLDGDPKKGFWSPFYLNDYVYSFIEEEKYSRLFQMNGLVIEEEDNVEIIAGQGLSATISEPEAKRKIIQFNIDNVIESATVPNNLANGQFWLDQESGILYINVRGVLIKLTKSQKTKPNQVFVVSNIPEGYTIPFPDMYFSSLTHILRLTVNDKYLIEGKDYIINEQERVITLYQNIVSGSRATFEFIDKDIVGLKTNYVSIDASEASGATTIDLSKYITRKVLNVLLYINGQLIHDGYSYDRQNLKLHLDEPRTDIKEIGIEVFEDPNITYTVRKLHTQINKNDLNVNDMYLYSFDNIDYRYKSGDIINILWGESIVLNEKQFTISSDGVIKILRPNINIDFQPDIIDITLLIFEYKIDSDFSGEGPILMEPKEEIIELNVGENSFYYSDERELDISNIKIYDNGVLMEYGKHYNVNLSERLVTLNFVIDELDYQLGLNKFTIITG